MGEMKGVVRWRRSSHVTVNSRIGVHRPNRSLSVKMIPLLSIAAEHWFGMTRNEQVMRGFVRSTRECHSRLHSHWHSRQSHRYAISAGRDRVKIWL